MVYVVWIDKDLGRHIIGLTKKRNRTLENFESVNSQLVKTVEGAIYLGAFAGLIAWLASGNSWIAAEVAIVIAAAVHYFCTWKYALAYRLESFF